MNSRLSFDLSTGIYTIYIHKYINTYIHTYRIYNNLSSTSDQNNSLEISDQSYFVLPSMSNGSLLKSLLYQLKNYGEVATHHRQITNILSFICA